MTPGRLRSHKRLTFITLKKEQLDYPCGVRRHENVENIATVLAYECLTKGRGVRIISVDHRLPDIRRLDICLYTTAPRQLPAFNRYTTEPRTFSTIDARERFGNEKEDWDTP
jgi:hypothetical protein